MCRALYLVIQKLAVKKKDKEQNWLTVVPATSKIALDKLPGNVKAQTRKTINKQKNCIVAILLWRKTILPLSQTKCNLMLYTSLRKNDRLQLFSRNKMDEGLLIQM